MAESNRILFAVALGAMLGSLARGGVSLAFLHAMGSGFPWGTLAVNGAGSFLIGLLATVVGPGGRVVMSAVWRQFLLAGFCGGFTTCSIFSLETVSLVRAGEAVLAASYVGLSLLSWLLAVWLGYRTGRRLPQLRARS